METIFYLFTFFAIIYELSKLHEPKKFQLKLEKMKKDKADGKSTSANENTFVFLVIGYVFWTFTGLLSSQWLIFLSTLLIGLLLTGYGKKTPIFLRRLDSLITVLLFLFMLINKFHLHIDLYQQLLLLF